MFHNEAKFTKDCEEVLALLGLDPVPVYYSYACYYTSATGSISMNIEDACTLEYEWYKNVAQYTRIGKSFNLIFWALLHEYGHYQDTMETYFDEEDEFYRELMLMLPEGTDRVMAYFNLPSEKVATQWAAEFIEDNKEKCLIANEILEKYVV